MSTPKSPETEELKPIDPICPKCRTEGRMVGAMNMPCYCLTCGWTGNTEEIRAFMETYKDYIH